MTYFVLLFATTYLAFTESYYYYYYYYSELSGLSVEGEGDLLGTHKSAELAPSCEAHWTISRRF